MSTFKRLDCPAWAYGHKSLIKLKFAMQGEKPTEEEIERAHIADMKLCGYEQMPPFFNREGFYYDRPLKFAWFEFNNEAWTKDGLEQDFLYEMECADARILEPVELKAIKTLIDYHSCPKELKEKLWKHAELIGYRNAYRGGLKARIRFEKFKKSVEEKKEKTCSK